MTLAWLFGTQVCEDSQSYYKVIFPSIKEIPSNLHVLGTDGYGVLSHFKQGELSILGFLIYVDPETNLLVIPRSSSALQKYFEIMQPPGLVSKASFCTNRTRTLWENS